MDKIIRLREFFTYKFQRYVSIIKGIIRPDSYSNLKKCDVLFFCHDVNRGYKYKEKAYSPLIDSMKYYFEKAGASCASVAVPYSLITERSAYGSPVSVNRSYFAGHIRYKLNHLISAKSSTKKSVFQLWMKIIGYSRPKVVIGIQPCVELCRACKMMNIPIYDLQHGVICEEEDWYRSRVKEVVDFRGLPSGFLCWDMASAAVLDKWDVSKKSKIYVIGNPWFRRFAEKNDDDFLVKEAVTNFDFNNCGRSNILVSLQWGLKDHGFDCDKNQFMPDCLEELIKKYHNCFNWHIRLHPVQTRGKEGLLVNDYLQNKFGDLNNVDWIKATKAPLPLLLEIVDAHITFWSSVTVEAAWYGIQTALLDPEISCSGKRASLFAYERSINLAHVLSLEVPKIEKWLFSAIGKKDRKNVQNFRGLDRFVSLFCKRV